MTRSTTYFRSLAIAAIFTVVGAGPSSAVPMIADFTGSPLVVNNDTLDFGPGGAQNIAAVLDTGVDFGQVRFVSDTDGDNASGDFFSGTSGPIYDENNVSVGGSASGGLPSADDEELYLIYTTYNCDGCGQQDSLLFATRSAVGGSPTGNGIAVDSIDGFNLGTPSTFGVGATVGPGNSFTQNVTGIGAAPFSSLANSSIYVPIEGGGTFAAPDDPAGDDRFVDNNGGATLGALGFFIERGGDAYYGFVLINDLPGRHTLEILGYGIESDPNTAITITLGGPPACDMGDADCDGDVDLDDIIAAVGNFTGPCTAGVDCFGDPGNGGSAFTKTRAEGDVNDGVPVVGSPPLQGDGDSDLDDIIDMVGSFTGPLDGEGVVAASADAGDVGLPDLNYDPITGEVFLDASDIGGTLQAYNIKNSGGGILNGGFTAILGGPPATNLVTEIGEFQLSPTATAPGGTSIGLVFPTGMDQAALEAFVTGGSASPSFGGGSFEWEVIAMVPDVELPEPSTVTLLGMGALGLALVGYRRRRVA